MNTLVQILPFALASAISPVLLTFALLSLGQKEKGTTKAWLFFLGALICICIVGSGIIFLYHGIRAASSQPTNSDIIVSIVVGFLLVLLGLRRLFTKKNSKTQKPKTSDGIFRYFSFGFIIMLANYTTIVMYFPAAVILSHQSSNSIKAFGLAEMVFFSTLPALIGPLCVLVAGSHAHVVLDPMRNFIQKYGRMLIGLVLLILGVYLLYKGINGYLMIK